MIMLGSFWVYNVVCGLLRGPRYSISQTMMGELSPPGFEYMPVVRLACLLAIRSTTVFRPI
ncbi:hypothetical protein EDB89DRAFT_2018649 [Lactarius sanguifluus]|nr:hypothetical protein EDB89DRAFT_2018649 [Lactarius sanguifluus]